MGFELKIVCIHVILLALKLSGVWQIGNWWNWGGIMSSGSKVIGNGGYCFDGQANEPMNISRNIIWWTALENSFTKKWGINSLITNALFCTAKTKRNYELYMVSSQSGKLCWNCLSSSSGAFQICYWGKCISLLMWWRSLKIVKTLDDFLKDGDWKEKQDCGVILSLSKLKSTRSSLLPQFGRNSTSSNNCPLLKRPWQSREPISKWDHQEVKKSWLNMIMVLPLGSAEDTASLKALLPGFGKPCFGFTLQTSCLCLVEVSVCRWICMCVSVAPFFLQSAKETLNLVLPLNIQPHYIHISTVNGYTCACHAAM